MKGKKSKKLYLLFLLLLMVTVGYAGLSSRLNIVGTSKLDDNIKWNVHFKEETANVTEGSVSTTVPTIDTNKTTVTYSIDLSKPKDFYEFTIDVVNVGSIDAMLNEITKATLEGTNAADITYLNNYIEYLVTYGDGMELNKDGNKDLLKAGTGKETLKVRVAMKDVDSLPAPKTLTFKLQLNYVQADSTATEREKKPLCKKATTLHTEICEHTSTTQFCSNYGYTTGATITYGNLESGNTLTSGDAFDCDVNNDGVYDSTTERFYYVSDYYDTSKKSFNSNYATLIYYSNTTGGVQDNNGYSAYDGSGECYFGPRTLAKDLPTISQWNNEAIYRPGPNRQILNENGENIAAKNTLPKYDYSNYAARLITAQELNKACGITIGTGPKKGELKNCEYLLENTQFSRGGNFSYGYWLETPVSKLNTVWGTSSGNVYVSYYERCNIGKDGVRPAITALKSNVLY